MTTDTPRTDALLESRHSFKTSVRYLSAAHELARTLERDLAECRAALRDCAYTLKIVCSVWPARNRPFSTSDDGKLVSVDPEATMAAARAILPPVEGEDALCRCGHYKRNHGNPIFPCMADGCSCAGFRALATKEPQPAATKIAHVCGLSGYNGMIDPPCPACEANRNATGVRFGPIATKEPQPTATQTECRECDGCGWYEGGATLKTTCHECNGTGVVTKEPQP